MYAEAELIAAANPLDKWLRATPDERERYATQAAITARRAIAQARRAGYETLADFIADTVDPPGLTLVSTRRLARVAPIGRFVIVDRIGLSIELIPHRFGTGHRPTGQRGLFAFWRNSSKVIDANAFRALIGIA